MTNLSKDRLDWNKILDQYLVNGTMSSDEYQNLADEYKFVIQEAKKAFKRLNKQNNDTEI